MPDPFRNTASSSKRDRQVQQRVATHSSLSDSLDLSSKWLSFAPLSPISYLLLAYTEPGLK